MMRPALTVVIAAIAVIAMGHMLEVMILVQMMKKKSTSKKVPFWDFFALSVIFLIKLRLL